MADYPAPESMPNYSTRMKSSKMITVQLLNGECDGWGERQKPQNPVIYTPMDEKFHILIIHGYRLCGKRLIEKGYADARK